MGPAEAPATRPKQQHRYARAHGVLWRKQCRQSLRLRPPPPSPLRLSPPHPPPPATAAVDPLVSYFGHVSSVVKKQGAITPAEFYDGGKYVLIAGEGSQRLSVYDTSTGKEGGLMCWGRGAGWHRLGW